MWCCANLNEEHVTEEWWMTILTAWHLCYPMVVFHPGRPAEEPESPGPASWRLKWCSSPCLLVDDIADVSNSRWLELSTWGLSSRGSQQIFPVWFMHSLSTRVQHSFNHHWKLAGGIYIPPATNTDVFNLSWWNSIGTGCANVKTVETSCRTSHVQ